MYLLKKSAQNIQESTLNSDDILDVFVSLVENGIDPVDAFQKIEVQFGKEKVEEILAQN